MKRVSVVASLVGSIVGCAASPPPSAPASEPLVVAPLAEPAAPPVIAANEPPVEAPPAAAPEPPPPSPDPTPPLPTTTIPPGKTALTVYCLPQCDVTLDKTTALGASPVTDRIIAPGKHVLTLTSGATKKTVTVDAQPDMKHMVRISMAPPAPPASSCQPPYTFDTQGVKHYRPECLGSATIPKMPVAH